MLSAKFFTPDPTQDNDLVSHIVIPTSVEHHYSDGDDMQFMRNALYIKKYESANNELDSNTKIPLIFFHGGPGIVNTEQFSILTRYFTQRGYAVYIPEIEGSGMYSCENNVPAGFEPSMVPDGLKLLRSDGLVYSGLNEFTKNYADDVKDVIEYVSQQHANQKVHVTTHSLGCHQVLRTLQHFPELNQKVEAICSVAGAYNAGVNRFWTSLNQIGKHFAPEQAIFLFYLQLEIDSKNFFKSDANVSQPGSKMTKTQNPTVNPQMNDEVSVLSSDVAGLPPILLIHASDDKSVFVQNSVLLYEKIQQQGAVVNGLFLKAGGHQFIKNEGDAEIRNEAFVKMHNFLKNPVQKDPQDLSTFEYEDVVAEHALFLEDQKEYLHNRYSPAPAPTI